MNLALRPALVIVKPDQDSKAMEELEVKRARSPNRAYQKCRILVRKVKGVAVSHDALFEPLNSQKIILNLRLGHYRSWSGALRKLGAMVSCLAFKPSGFSPEQA